MSFNKSYTFLWPNVGHYALALAKSNKTTTWLWNLYIITHDFESQISKPNVTSKVFASNLVYLSTVFIWLGGIYFYKVYFSNFSSWLLSFKNTLTSAHIIWFIVNQNIFNMDLGSYYTGKVISSGLFQLWLSQGILCQLHLKLASFLNPFSSTFCATKNLIHFHINFS